MKTLSRTADDLVRSYRTFGEYGPLYEVVRKTSDSHVHIRVVESGEELDYSVEKALSDPEAE